MKKSPIKKHLFGIFLLGLLACASPTRGTQQKLDNLLVYGQGFLFSIKEPADWNGDTENSAKFGANVILHEKGQPMESFVGLIRVRVDEKTDENIAEDMKADMDEYRSRYSKVQFRDFTLNCPQYRCLGKVFYLPGRFYEYVTYVNPGPKSKLMFSVSLSSEKTEPSPKEIEAYKKTTESLVLLSH